MRLSIKAIIRQHWQFKAFQQLRVFCYWRGKGSISWFIDIDREVQQEAASLTGLSSSNTICHHSPQIDANWVSYQFTFVWRSLKIGLDSYPVPI